MEDRLFGKLIRSRLEDVESLETAWLVGSYQCGDWARTNVDVLATVADADLTKGRLAIGAEVAELWPTRDIVVVDDAVQFESSSGVRVSVGVYQSDALVKCLRGYAQGLGLNGHHRHWATGYWLPEALCGDIQSGNCFIDKKGVALVAGSVVGSYPNRMASAVVELCLAEIDLKLDRLKKALSSDLRMEAGLLRSDICLAYIRLVFATERVYLRGFGRLDWQLQNLPGDSKMSFLIDLLRANEEFTVEQLFSFRRFVRGSCQ